MSDVMKLYHLGVVAMERVLSETNMSDEVKAYLLDRFIDESSILDNYDLKPLDLMEFSIWCKYKKHNKHFKELVDDFINGYKETYGSKTIDMITKLNNDDLQIIDFIENRKVG